MQPTPKLGLTAPRRARGRRSPRGATPAARPGRYELRTGADVFGIITAGGTLAVRRGAVEKPDATLDTSVNMLRAVCYGQRTLAQAVDAGEAHLTGEQDAVDHLLALLRAPFRTTSLAT